MQCSESSFVRDLEKEVSLIRQDFCVEQIERSDVTQKSNTPASTTSNFRPRKQLEQDLEGPYRRLIGGLMWIEKMTSSGIINVVRELPKQAHDPATQHWQAALRVLEYLNDAIRSLGVRVYTKGEGSSDQYADGVTKTLSQDTS